MLVAGLLFFEFLKSLRMLIFYLDWRYVVHSGIWFAPNKCCIAATKFRFSLLTRVLLFFFTLAVLKVCKGFLNVWFSFDDLVFDAVKEFFAVFSFLPFWFTGHWKGMAVFQHCCYFRWQFNSANWQRLRFSQRSNCRFGSICTWQLIPGSSAEHASSQWPLRRKCRFTG